MDCEKPRVFAWAVGDVAYPGATWRFTFAPSGEGTVLRQWVQMGPARSGLSVAIERTPEKEQKIVFVRLREYEAGMAANLGGDQGAGRGNDGWGVGLIRTATTVEASNRGSWSETLAFVVEAERLGLDVCFVAEAWGSDGPSALGYLAARTERMLLGSGIVQLGTRTPVAIAQTALTESPKCPAGGSCWG